MNINLPSNKMLKRTIPVIILGAIIGTLITAVFGHGILDWQWWAVLFPYSMGGVVYAMGSGK